ncbi:MAG TPA: alpha-L-fucosidase [Terracidiphilus sp.]|jgi:alpha-L-fucosidase|nr:alpha-L-fucosidase [Terracidiphilus sp.]
MSAYWPSRRDFIKTAIASSCVPFLSNVAWAETAEDERIRWYRDAKFGMFMHWGPYSLASVEASWPIMRPTPGGITQAEYEALPQRFNPTLFDPEAFVDLARSAGQKYMVFTTKHHDGFCMFDSQYTSYKITNAPYGKDIVKQLSDACLKDGMPLGFYYSPPDMHNPNFRDTSKPASENWHGQPERPEWPLYLQYLKLQVTELLTRYGPAALVWFDGLNDQAKYDGVDVVNMIHRLQPATLVNDRIGVPGDFETPEQFIPKAIPTMGVHISGTNAEASEQLKNTVPAAQDFRLWETCMTINHTWAYNKNDHDFKSSQTLIRSLVEVASRGGNFLLNVGPEPTGQIQPEFQQRLRAIGDWLRLNGDSIYGSTYGPIQGVSSLRTTAKDKSVYVHLFDWNGTSCELPDFNTKLISARLLANGRPLTFRQDEAGLRIDVPAQAPDPNVSVIALETY